MIVPELSTRDQGKTAAALMSAANALTQFQRAGVVDKETMAQVLAVMLSQLGIEADPFEILRRAKAEKLRS